MRQFVEAQCEFESPCHGRGFRLYAGIFTLILVVVLGFTACKAADIATIRQDDEIYKFYVDVARTREDLERGLMFVEAMPKDRGMVFLYNPAQPVKFWMKNTLIPLDMLFFDDRNVLVHIEHNVQPHDLTLRGPSNDVLICSVIELNGGTAAQLGFRLGAKLTINFEHECLQKTGK